MTRAEIEAEIEALRRARHGYLEVGILTSARGIYADIDAYDHALRALLQAQDVIEVCRGVAAREFDPIIRADTPLSVRLSLEGVVDAIRKHDAQDPAE